MLYKEALKYIDNLGMFGMNFGLKRIERLCELLSNPQRDLKIIHVGGTNGKGSTCAFLSNILSEAGYSVGLYTSPHLERLTERMKVNGIEISEDEVAEYTKKVIPAVEKLKEEGFDHPTQFEVLTAMAFLYFKDKKVDFLVLEVGLGGRLDATNVVAPLLSIITSIDYDHVNVLGNTLGEIAGEKAGIIKKNTPVVIYPQEDEALNVLLKKAEENNSRVYMVSKLNYEIKSSDLNGTIFDVSGDINLKEVKINLKGNYQVSNALTAIMASYVLRDIGYKIDENSLRLGLERTKWPGRFEIVSENPYIILDGGHNMQGIRVFTESIKRYFKDKKIKLVCGILRDKDFSCMADMLSKIAEHIITVTPDSPRALSAKELKEIFESRGVLAEAADSIKEAVDISTSNLTKDDVLAFCGSLYMIGEARRALGVKNIYKL